MGNINKKELLLKIRESNITQLLEAMDEVSNSLSIQYTSGDSLLDAPIDDEPGRSLAPTDELSNNNPMETADVELLDALNQIFTPILVMQGFEGDVIEKIHESCSEANVLMERNIISFDNNSRMAQLLSVCALLIARQKNSPKYQMYKKAMEIAKSTKLEIQKTEYAAAQALAQKFLVKVSTTNGSTVARKSAQDLLPMTN